MAHFSAKCNEAPILHWDSLGLWLAFVRVSSVIMRELGQPRGTIAVGFLICCSGQLSKRVHDQRGPNTQHIWHTECTLDISS